MKIRSRLFAEEDGAAAIEMAFAIPVLIIMLWAIIQLAQVYRAVAAMQQALGEGARYATLCLTPGASGCTAPSAGSGSSPASGTIKWKINNSFYDTGVGTFTAADPVSGVSGTAKYYDLSVTYSQPTSLLLLPGPTMTLTRSKRVWISTN